MKPKRQLTRQLWLVPIIVLLAVVAFGGPVDGQTVDPSQTDSEELPPADEGDTQTESEEASPGIQEEIEEETEEAGFSDEKQDQIQSKVNELVAAGVPEDIALAVVKKGLDQGLDAAGLLQELETLKQKIENGTPPGQAKEEVLGTEDDSDDSDEGNDEGDDNGNGPPDNPGNDEDESEDDNEDEGNDSDEGDDEGDDNGNGPPDNPGNDEDESEDDNEDDEE